MSGSVSFNGIPVSIRVPGTYVEIDSSRAVRGLSAWPAKVLIVGQRLTAGTAAAGVPVRVTSAEQARTLFGRASMLAQMCAAWFRANTVTETWALPINEPSGGVTASAVLAVGGTATAAGTISLLIHGRRVDVAVASGTAAAAVATAIGAAINANLDLLVTAAVATTNVTVTARARGLEGNAIDIRHSAGANEALPAGITLTTPAMAGGTLAPTADLGTALDALGDVWFTDIISNWSDVGVLAALESRLSSQFGPMQMRDCHAWVARPEATFSALATYGAARNSPHVSIMGYRNSPTPPWEWASVLGAVCIPALAIDPARPVQTLALPGLIAPVAASRFTWSERDLLLRDGISTFRVDDGGNVLIERVVTTYQTSPAGAEDISYLDVETMKTLAFLRYDLRQMIALRYPRHKLADDGTNFARGQAVATPGLIRAEIVARAIQWESAGLVEGIEGFKRDIIVVRSATDPNRVDALLPPDIVNQLRVVAAQIQFLL